MSKQYVVFNKETGTYLCGEETAGKLHVVYKYNPEEATIFSNFTEMQDFSFKFNRSIIPSDIMPLEVAKSFRYAMAAGFTYTHHDTSDKVTLDNSGWFSLKSDFIISHKDIVLSQLCYVEAFDLYPGLYAKFNSTIITSNYNGQYNKDYYFNGYRFIKKSLSTTATGFSIENSDKSVTCEISGFERSFEKYQDNKELYKAIQLAKIFFEALEYEKQGCYSSEDYFEDVYGRDFVFRLNIRNDNAYLFEDENNIPILSFNSSSYMTIIGDPNYLGKISGIPETGLSFKHRNGQEFTKGIFKAKKPYEEYLEFELELSKLYVDSKFPFDKE